ncbi:MAG TPA: hypothetical protein VLF62_06560, partial [Candidatus Saccharimonadales bacterium]|nr:hypothetical protein [Candidatus Saccharimonadales bacterium]
MSAPEAAAAAALPPTPTDEHWRGIVRETIRDYLGPDFDPADPPCVIAAARRHGFTGELDTEATYKSQRYAAIGALSWKMTGDHLITGFGIDAEFQNIDPGTMDSIDADVADAFLKALKATTEDPDSRGAHLANRIRSVDAAGGTPLIFIGAGGTAVSEIKNFNTFVPRAINTNPATRRIPEAGRVALGHVFTAASLGRAG